MYFFIRLLLCPERSVRAKTKLRRKTVPSDPSPTQTHVDDLIRIFPDKNPSLDAVKFPSSFPCRKRITTRHYSLGRPGVPEAVKGWKGK